MLIEPICVVFFSVWDVGDRQQHWLFRANQTRYKLFKKFGVGDGHMGVLCVEADGLELCDNYRFILIRARFHPHCSVKFKQHSHLLMKAWKEEQPWSYAKSNYTRTWVYFPFIGALERVKACTIFAHMPVISRQGDFHKKIVCDSIAVENDQSDDERSADTAQDFLGKLNSILMYIKTRQPNFMSYNALVASAYRTRFWYWCAGMEEAVKGYISTFLYNWHDSTECRIQATRSTTLSCNLDVCLSEFDIFLWWCCFRIY